MSDPTSVAAPAATAPASAPALSYDVPQEVSYSGQSFIELALDPSYFRAQADTQESPS